MPLPPEQRKDILVSMAARDAAFTADDHISARLDDDKARARERIKRKLGEHWDQYKRLPQYSSGVVKLQKLLDDIVVLLQTSDITHSTNPDLFSIDLGDRMKNCWHLNRGSGLREQTEQRLYDYGGENATERMQQYGTGGQRGGTPNFEPSIRPMYAAVNYSRARYGASSAYGKCHFVFKSILRFNATFTYADSFGVSSTHKDQTQLTLANYHNMYPLILHAPDGSGSHPDVLKALIDHTLGLAEAPDELFEGRDYIEAQIPGDILFSRDVEKLVAARAEVAPTSRQGKKMKAFAKKHKILLEFV